ncbi:hypothetical protein [Pseudomonas sp. LS-2]|nr:hypothetical protein [Pseudomonas sp. LS-2]
MIDIHVLVVMNERHDRRSGNIALSLPGFDDQLKRKHPVESSITDVD